VIFISVVIENLKEAIIGESNAKRKYELFAEKALNEGFPEIAHLFKAISTAESIHIKNHLKAIEEITKKSVDLNAIVNIEEKVLKKQVRNTRNNLIQAIAGETFEFKKIYKGFMKNAKKNDVYLAEFSFDLARMAEIVHSKLYIRFLKKLEKKEPFEDIDIYVCRICGNVELKKIPKICPNCEHDQKFFMKA
jgi:rubrerythrin